MSKRVEILSRKRIFDQAIFHIDEIRLRHELFSGQMSPELVRLEVNRGDSAAAVVHRLDTNTLIFTDQFRVSTYEKGPGWLLEIPAGMVAPHESPAATMRRELEEEIGYRVTHLQPIHTFYLSPGGTSERIILFYAQVQAFQQVSSGGGVKAEGEDIRVVEIPRATVFDKLDSGEIADAKTIIGLQWLRARQDRL